MGRSGFYNYEDRLDARNFYHIYKILYSGLCILKRQLAPTKQGVFFLPRQTRIATPFSQNTNYTNVESVFCSPKSPAKIVFKLSKSSSQLQNQFNSSKQFLNRFHSSKISLTAPNSSEIGFAAPKSLSQLKILFQKHFKPPKSSRKNFYTKNLPKYLLVI